MASTAPPTFSALLRRLRLAAGLTQEDLAERAGLSTRGVQDLERGARTAPRAQTVRMLADGLRLDDAARAELIAAAQPYEAAPRGRHTPSRLPSSLTPLIGREREMAQACALLGGQDSGERARLLTLTGPGGVGKTRLALAIASELATAFSDGVTWVELAPLRDPALVPAEVARTLGVREDGNVPLVEALTGVLAEQHLLLILDNCEHLPEAMPLVTELLAATPTLVVLATSRMRLRLRGEREMHVGPLATPEGDSVINSPLSEVASVRLFVERARAVEPKFILSHETAVPVAAICRRVEGLPLALELAAARVKILPPTELLERLERRLPLLSGGARDLPLRQQTMRDAISWSYDLLSPAEQTLFRRLAVFAGGFTLEAVEAFGAQHDANDAVPTGAPVAVSDPPPSSVLDVIASLVDQSLLRVENGPGGEPRFVMLETVREFALERLMASSELESAHHTHANYCLKLAETAQTRIHGPEGSALLDRLELEHDNLRSALTWLIEGGQTDLALRLAYASWRFWWMHSHLHEGRSWLERALALPEASDAISAYRPRTLVAAGYFARVQGDYTQAIAMGEHALTLSRQVGDAHGTSSALHLLGLAALDQGDLEQARTHLQASLALDRQLAYSHGVAFQLSNLGDVATAQGNLAEAAAYGEEALAIWRERGDAWSVAWALVQLGKVRRAQGDETGALDLFRQSLATSAALGDKEIAARATFEVAAIAGERGHFERAAHLFGCAARLRDAIGAPLSPAERARHDHSLIVTRAALDEATFTENWVNGQDLTFEQAVAAALSAASESS